MNNIRIWWFGEFVILWSHSYGKHICIYFLDFIDHILVLGIFYDKCLMEIHFENLSINNIHMIIDLTAMVRLFVKTF